MVQGYRATVSATHGAVRGPGGQGEGLDEHREAIVEQAFALLPLAKRS